MAACGIRLVKLATYLCGEQNACVLGGTHTVSAKEELLHLETKYAEGTQSRRNI
jgi:hypothetical protein